MHSSHMKTCGPATKQLICSTALPQNEQNGAAWQTGARSAFWTKRGRKIFVRYKGEPSRERYEFLRDHVGLQAQAHEMKEAAN
jgi:hypothetical protein